MKKSSLKSNIRTAKERVNNDVNSLLFWIMNNYRSESDFIISATMQGLENTLELAFDRSENFVSLWYQIGHCKKTFDTMIDRFTEFDLDNALQLHLIQIRKDLSALQKTIDAYVKEIRNERAR